MNFHIDSRLKGIPDIQRTFKWELKIPGINNISTIITDPDQFMIRVKSAAIPGRGVELIETNFQGMKQFFAGRPTFPHTLALTVEEDEEQTISKLMYEWHNKIFSTDPTDTLNGGGSQVNNKVGSGTITKGYATDIYLYLQKYDSTEELKSFRFINAFPSDVGDVALDYNTSDKVTFNITFSYDRWDLMGSTTA